MSYPSRRRHTPEQWQQLVEAQAVSGRSQAAFCNEHGLSKSSFQHWKRRLRSNAAGASAAAAGPTLFTLFTLITDTRVAPEPESGWTIELDLGDGVCLRLRRSGP